MAWFSLLHKLTNAGVINTDATLSIKKRLRIELKQRARKSNFALLQALISETIRILAVQ